MTSIRFVPSVLFLFALAVAPAHGVTVTNTAVADTTLFEQSPNNNLGRSSLAAGSVAQQQGGKRSRALIKFDVSNLPADAVVTNVRVALRVIKAPSGAVNSTFGLHRVVRSWGEGAKGSASAPLGGTAAAGEASWVNRLTGQVGGAWTANGAVSPTDFIGIASGTANVAGVGAVSFNSTAGLLADVQSWKMEPTLNFGWILISQSESSAKTARRFGNREGTASAAPMLIIEYSVGPLVTAPSIVSHPTNLVVSANGTATFKVQASGSEPFTYQWRFNNEDIPGQNADTLLISPVATTHEGTYSVVVSNSAGNAPSDPATLTVIVPPTVTERPADVVVLAGDTLQLTVNAAGTAPFTYVWRRNGTPIPDATTSILTITNVQIAHSGSYTAEVRNSAGFDTSAAGIVTVLAAVRIEAITVLGPLASLHFTVPMGYDYALEGSSTMSPDTWSAFTNITAKFAPVQAVVNQLVDQPRKFYRLRATQVD